MSQLWTLHTLRYHQCGVLQLKRVNQTGCIYVSATRSCCDLSQTRIKVLVQCRFLQRIWRRACSAYSVPLKTWLCNYETIRLHASLMTKLCFAMSQWFWKLSCKLKSCEYVLAKTNIEQYSCAHRQPIRTPAVRFAMPCWRHRPQPLHFMPRWYYSCRLCHPSQHLSRRPGSTPSKQDILLSRVETLPRPSWLCSAARHTVKADFCYFA